MSFLKNIATFGGYDKLQNEQREFNNLAKSFSLIQDRFIELNQSHFNALSFLKSEREEVVRNISLTKNLISKIHTTPNGKKNTVKNDFVTYIENEKIEFTLGDVSIDFKGKLDSVSEAFVTSLEGSFKRLDNRKDNKKGISKAELKAELGMIAVDVLISGVAKVFELNSEVNQKRREINEAKREINNAYSKMLDQVPKIYSEVKRMVEIAKVLNKHNQVFSLKYKTIQDELNVKPKFKIYIREILNKKIIPSNNIEQNLHQLISYSSEYSKFNNESEI